MPKINSQYWSVMYIVMYVDSYVYIIFYTIHKYIRMYLNLYMYIHTSIMLVATALVCYVATILHKMQIYICTYIGNLYYNS